MLPGFQAPPLASLHRSTPRNVPICATATPKAKPVSPSAQPSFPPPSSLPVPPHSAVVWQATLPPYPTSEKLPHILHTYFAHHFPSLSAAKRAIRRRELYLRSSAEWRVATVLDRPRGGDLVARAARVEMASVRSRLANRQSQLALADGFVKYVDNEKQCAVVIKPPGVAMGGTLREAIFVAVGDTVRRQENVANVVGAVLRRPVAVHRLDKVAGGLVVVALTQTAVRSLSEQFHRRGVQKTYRARVEGTVELTRQVVRSPVDGKNAETRVVVVARGTGWTEVLLSPITGRRHQLRVHMKKLGHPILFDTTYGAKRVHPVLGEDGICLWAEQIAFRHPTDGNLVEVDAEAPSDFFEHHSKL